MMIEFKNYQPKILMKMKEFFRFYKQSHKLWLVIQYVPIMLYCLRIFLLFIMSYSLMPYAVCMKV